jgi:hypothetical protein
MKYEVKFDRMPVTYCSVQYIYALNFLLNYTLFFIFTSQQAIRF